MKKVKAPRLVLVCVVLGLLAGIIYLAVKGYQGHASSNNSSLRRMSVRGRRVGNPGCSISEQAECTQRSSCEEDNNNTGVQCVACDDWEGEGCVPKSCVCTACQNPPASCGPAIDG